jgi:hypothetical protein
MLVARAALALLALALLGCEPEPRTLALRLELPAAIGCRPTGIDTIEVRAFGDFPTRDRDVLVLRPGDELARIDRFARDTRLITVEARGSLGREPWTGGGIAFVGDRSSEVVVPLLSYRRACPLADPSARALDGAAFASLADGRLMLVGGHEGARVREGIVTLHPAEPLSARSPARFFVDRTGATLTALEAHGDEQLVVLAGGSGSVEGPGEDTFEVLHVASGVEARVGDGFLASRRRDHAAVRIDADAVLLVGGRADLGEPPLDALERIHVDARGRASASVVARSAIARIGPTALQLEDGTVAIVGGVSAEGEPIGRIERFDPASSTVVLDDASFPPRRRAAYVALAGGRIAQLGGRDEDGWTGRVELRLEQGSDPAVVELGALLPALEAPRAVALPDGRVIVVGRDVASGRARGVLLDPGAAEVSPLEASRTAALLVALIDGTLVEGDDEGLSTLRVDVRTALDAPPATLTPALMEDRARLALDAPDHWSAVGGTLRADVELARFDLAGLRFAGFSLEVEGVGALDVLLVRDGAPALVLRTAQDEVALDACRVPRLEGAPLRITRTGDALIVDAGLGAVSCVVSLPTRVGLAFRAPRGAGVRRIAIARQ